jgi:hypothetical protein
MSDPTVHGASGQEPEHAPQQAQPGYPTTPPPPPPPPPGYASAPPPPYGSAPAYPAAPQYGAPAPVPADPPPPLALAVRLMYLGAVLSVIASLLTLLQRDALRSQLADSGLNASQLDTALSVAVVSAVVAGLIGAGLWVLNAVFNARGAKWARILSTVLGGLAVLSTLASLTQPASGLNRLLSIVELLIALAVIVLIWRPESSRYYEARSGVPTV